MNNSLNEQIYRNMNLKETDELLEIWHKNDRDEWSDVAFNVIKEILEQRLGEVPLQDETLVEYDDEIEYETFGFSELELKIIDDEYPPEFYNPLEVLTISRKIDSVAKVVIVLTIIYNIVNFGNSQSIVYSYFRGGVNSNWLLVNVLALFLSVLNTAFSIAITYFPLKALSYLLTTLMQMEFNSRPKGSQ